MNFNIKKVPTLLLAIALTISTFAINYTKIEAATVESHIRIVGSEKTVWFGDITTDGCTITDKDSGVHNFTQPVAVCALDAASKTGSFTYSVKDFGGSLGLFLEAIGTDSGAADFSTYWSYDLNGQSAQQGISSQIVNSGDSLYFHFEDPNISKDQRAINDGITYLRSQQEANGQISGFSGISSWAAMAFAAANIDPATVTKGTTSLLDYLKNNPPASNAAATEWERGILTITSAGLNPFDFEGINYVSKLETHHNNSQLGSTTQVNDDVFGLLALVSAGSSAPLQTKQDALNFILSHQGSDGGFSWSTTGTSDVDDTSAALQALAAAANAGLSAPNLQTAITNAKNFVLAAKNSDGGFPYSQGDSSNSSTTAWVVMALSSLGITGDDMNKAKAYIRGSQEEDGSFKWQAATTGETFTSSYAVIALTGKFWPVKVFAGTVPNPSPSASPTPTATPTSTPTPSPSVAVTPSASPTPSPSVTVSPSPIPSPSTAPGRNDWQRRLMQRQNAMISRMIEKQKQIFDKMQKRIQEQLDKLSKFKLVWEI